MKQFIMRTVRTLLPAAYYAISSYRFHRRCRKRFGAFQAKFREEVYGNREITVLTGPFRGMKYFDNTVWGPITPKWLGSYESELHTLVSEMISKRYRKIIDVGAAEGYYAVGFALKVPTAQVIAYDVDPIARRRQSSLSRLNQTSNLAIKGECNFQTLATDLSESGLLICDIEGAEYELLDPLLCSALKKADILVEIHPWGSRDVNSVATTLMQRFADSHVITSIAISARDPADVEGVLPHERNWEGTFIHEAMNEHRRFTQTWLWMVSQSEVD